MPVGVLYRMTIPVFTRNLEIVNVPAEYHDGLIFDLFDNPSACTIDTNANLKVSSIGSPSNDAVDFFIIASSIYASDKLILRKDAADNWTRSFQVNIPSNRGEVWDLESNSLTRTISFLTGDHWQFQWRTERTGLPQISTESPRMISMRPDCLCLFSGGIDSLVGAINFLTDGYNVILVSHLDNGYIGGIQNLLVQELQNEFGDDRVKLIRIELNPSPPRDDQEYPLPYRSQSGRRVNEPTTRSRSLLYLSLGFLVASAIGPEVPVFVPENGFIALNVPMIIPRLGSCSTRTMHPYFLNGLKRVIETVGIANPLINPLEHMTKGQVLSNCTHPNLIQRLAPMTISCAHPLADRYHGSRPGNCGYCFPCIIRRAAMFKAGIDDSSAYRYDICTDTDVLNPYTSRSEDPRAVFAGITRFNVASPSYIDVLRPGPLPPDSHRNFLRLFREGIEELRLFFLEQSSPQVLQIAGF